MTNSSAVETTVYFLCRFEHTIFGFESGRGVNLIVGSIFVNPSSTF